MAPLVPWIPAILTAGGALLSGLGEIQRLRQQEADARAGAAIATTNAQLVAQQSAVEQQKARLRAREAIGEQRATLARAGVEIDAGSPFVLTSTAIREQEHEIDLLKRAKDIEAAGLLFEAARLRQQAKAFGSAVPWTLLGTAVKTGFPFFDSRLIPTAPKPKPGP